MDPWLVWLIAAVVFGIGEIATLGFFLAPFAAGAALAAVVSAAGAGEAVAWIIFLVVAVIMLAALRPIARSHRRQPAALRTGTAALVGRKAMVLERIANDEGTGSVRLEGERWTARAYDEDEVFEAGARVHVVEIRGATALVTED
jgi:membrane protein implicated in regulation of membrane protease activity